ncbi:MAG: tetratricopeptide repeat protein [Candidatus Omnitrophica bacterium]|nr:tetratricopeptide repeat protein [Candidatus Omnitrophota bacterium]
MGDLKRQWWVAAVSLALAGCAHQLSLLGPGNPIETPRQLTAQQQAYAQYTRGLLYEREGRLTEAVRAYREALEFDYHAPELATRLASVLLRTGRAQEALGVLQRATTEDPAYTPARNLLALWYTSTGQLDAAAQQYETILQVAPDNLWAQSALADLCVLRGDLARAATIYEHLIGQDEESPLFHFNLAVIDGRLQRFPEAIKHLSRAVSLNPSSVETHLALGFMHELTKNLPAAIREYETAAQLDPLNVRVYHHLGRAYYANHEVDKAVRQYQLVLDLAPRDVEALLTLVRMYLATGRLTDAEQMLQGLIAQGRDSAEVEVALGLVYRAQHRGPEALAAFEQAVTMAEEYPLAHFYVAVQYDEAGDRAQTKTHLRRSIELDPDQPDALNYLGYLQVDEGINLDESLQMIQRALVLDPDNGAYIDSLGWAFYKLGRYDEAVKALQRAVQLVKDDPVVQEHLGDALAHLDRGDEAIAAWQASLTLKQDQPAVQKKLDEMRQRLHQTTSSTATNGG